MAEAESKSFWTSVPGILTGITALVTAVAGLLTVLYQIGLIGGQPPTPAEQPPPPQTEQSPPPQAEQSPPSQAEQSPPPTPAEQSSPTPKGFRIVEMMLRANPVKYSGPCPVTIKFSGRISVAGGGGQVSYKFLRKDGASGPIKTLDFASAGTKNVATTWRLGAPGQSFRGWRAIKTFDPEEKESNRATFQVQCE